MPRIAAPTVLLACAASLLAAPNAAANLHLPPGADAPPALPPGVVVAEHPELRSETGQGPLMATAGRSGTKRSQAGGEARPFWATVNVCDTRTSPNALGIRTSVPGNGSRERIFARYTAQWWSGDEQKWLTVAGSGVTPWVLLGGADMTSRQAGWTFRFAQPPVGTTYVLRGVVELQWRDHVRKSRRAAQKLRRVRKNARRAHRAQRRRRARRTQRAAVVLERTLLTKTGVKGVQGGDPAGLSKALCLIW